MFRRSYLLLCLLLSFLPLVAQEKLTNESILKLSKAGIGEETIIGMIRAQPSAFSLNTDAVIELKGGGISDRVIAAMVAKAAGDGSPVPVTAAGLPPVNREGLALPDELGVYRTKDGKFVTVSPEILNLRTARGAQLAVGVLANAKLNGYVVNEHSPNHVAPDTEFVVKLPEGTDPAEYVCLKFDQKKDRREVELARGRINISTGTQRSAVPFTSEKLAKQVYKLKFGAFKPGEYGLLPPGANISSNASSAGKIYTFLVE
jgi:hypothetical protein